MKSRFAFLVAFAIAADARAQTIVHVDNPRVTIERKEDDTWVEVCSAPCDRALPPFGLYRVAGDNVKRHAFTLDGLDRRSITLHVEAGSRTQQMLGISLAATGGAAIFTGLVFLLIGAVQYQCNDCVSGYANTTLLNYGWALVIGGVVSEAVGAALVVATQTTVTIEPQAPPPPRAMQFPLVRLSF